MTKIKGFTVVLSVRKSPGKNTVETSGGARVPLSTDSGVTSNFALRGPPFARISSKFSYVLLHLNVHVFRR